jgi:hypothetical protein
VNDAKLDSALRRALQGGDTMFTILVRFKPAPSVDDARALKLTLRGELATGRATRDLVEQLSDRDDVVSIALAVQPSATRKPS